MKKLSLYIFLVLMWCNAVYAFNFEEDYVCLSVKGEVINGVFVPEDNYKNLIDMSLQDKKIQDLFEGTKDYTLKVRNKKTDPSQEGTYIETSGFSGWFYAHKSPGNKRTIAHIIKENKLLLLFKFQKDHKKLVKDKSKRELFMQVIELADDEFNYLMPFYLRTLEAKSLYNPFTQEPYLDALNKVLGEEGIAWGISSYVCFEE